MDNRGFDSASTPQCSTICNLSRPMLLSCSCVIACLKQVFCRQLGRNRAGMVAVEVTRAWVRVTEVFFGMPTSRPLARHAPDSLIATFPASIFRPSPDTLHRRQATGVLPPPRPCPTPRPNPQPSSLRSMRGLPAHSSPGRAMASSPPFVGSPFIPSGIDSNARLRILGETSSSSSTPAQCSSSGPSSFGPTRSSRSWRSSIIGDTLEVPVRMKKRCFQSVWMRSATYPISLPTGSPIRCWYDSVSVGSRGVLTR